LSYQDCSLKQVPFAEIHACFAAAFADYAVKSVVMDENALRRRADKNDWVPECSVGVQADGKLVAVSLTGIDVVGEETRAYDICTGIIPEHRGKGLAGMIIKAMVPRLVQAGAAAFQLEVLQNNLAGIRAYEKAGFVTTRALVSHEGTIDEVVPAPSQVFVRSIGLRELLQLSSQLEFQPSFEQRDAAIVNLRDDLITLGAVENERCVAALAYDPETAWIMRLVTHRQFRRRGLARALLSDLACRIDDGGIIKAVNIDERDEATRALMFKCGMKESLKQWEMRLSL